MGKSMAVIIVDSDVIAAIGAKPPSDDDWKRYVRVIACSGIARVLIYSDGGVPTLEQRRLHQPGPARPDVRWRREQPAHGDRQRASDWALPPFGKIGAQNGHSLRCGPTQRQIRRRRPDDMILKPALRAFVTAALVLGGCSKKDENGAGATTAAVATAPAPPPMATSTAAASASALPSDSAAVPAPSGSAAAGNSDEVPQSGTYEVLEEFIVHKGPGDATPILTHVPRGTLVNLKASHFGWTIIEYPSGKDELSLGWVQVKAGDSRFKLRKDKTLNGRRRRHD